MQAPDDLGEPGVEGVLILVGQHDAHVPHLIEHDRIPRARILDGEAPPRRNRAGPAGRRRSGLNQWRSNPPLEPEPADPRPQRAPRPGRRVMMIPPPRRTPGSTQYWPAGERTERRWPLGMSKNRKRRRRRASGPKGMTSEQRAQIWRTAIRTVPPMIWALAALLSVLLER